MEDVKAEVNCEKCNVLFEIKANQYEKAMENEELVLCVDCYSFMLDEQEKANAPVQRNFEYFIIPEKEMNVTIGEAGWELISVDNGMLYFKREILKGVKNEE
jgi:hypothetical protein